MTSNSLASCSSSSYPSMDLKGLCNTIMNTDARVRFVGILDNKNAKLVEGGMPLRISSPPYVESNPHKGARSR